MQAPVYLIIAVLAGMLIPLQTGSNTQLAKGFCSARQPVPQ